MEKLSILGLGGAVGAACVAYSYPSNVPVKSSNVRVIIKSSTKVSGITDRDRYTVLLDDTFTLSTYFSGVRYLLGKKVETYANVFDTVADYKRLNLEFAERLHNLSNVWFTGAGANSTDTTNVALEDSIKGEDGVLVYKLD
jgi:hypothetical protein